MKAFHYLKVDLRNCRHQFLCMFVFIVLAYVFIRSSKSTLMGFGYIIFAAVLMQGTCFTYEQKKDTGFINLLPGTDIERIIGRFLFGILSIVMGMICVGFSVGVLKLQGMKVETPHLNEQIMLFVGVGLLFLSIQNIFFYIVGKGNSQQLMTYIHMLPGLILWIAITIVIGIFEEDDMIHKISWFMDHLLFISVFMLVIGIVSNIIAIVISAKIVAGKDYS